jgi:hypothetical protein
MELIEGLSRVLGNSYARFLGEKELVMTPPYPTQYKGTKAPAVETPAAISNQPGAAPKKDSVKK